MNNGQVIPWDVVLMNRGSGYDPNTGVFTAPIAGYYFFTYNAIRVASTAGLYIAFRKNQIFRGKLDRSQNDSTYSNHQLVSSSFIIDLEVGDTVDVWLATGELYSFHNKFNGFYLSS